MHRKETKMTIREFYNAVLNANVSDEITEKATELIAQLDARNEKAKARPRKADPAVAERKNVLAHFVDENEGEFIADEIAEATGLTPAQIASGLRAFVAAGTVTKGTRKIDSKHSKVVYKIGA
jgi:DNA-binding transcriptional regulator GbsR (MarR family)